MNLKQGKPGERGLYLEGAYNRMYFLGLRVDLSITSGGSYKRQFAVFHIVCLRLSFFSVNDHRHHHHPVVQLSLETQLKNVHRILLALFVTVPPRMPWNSAMAALGRNWRLSPTWVKRLKGQELTAWIF